MRRHLVVGGFALVAASLGLAPTPAAACDDGCGCGYGGYYGYGAAYYGGYYGGYYGRPAYSYYAAPVYAAPVYYSAPAYYAPAYYAPPAYYPPPGYYYGAPYGRPYYGWRGGLVDAGQARGKGNLAPPANVGSRALYALNKGAARVSKAPPAPAMAAPALRVERARAANPGMRPPTAAKPQPLPVRQPTVTASRRNGAQMVRLSSSGVGQLAPVRRQDR